jgi:CPA1 family monovalent cation:H+ antiporter
MPETFVLTLLLAMFLCIALLSTLADRLHASTPVVMLIAGIVIALLPGVPAITLDPDLTLLGLLPPLLYSSGVGMSWRGFRANLRPILSLAIGCVLFTASAVAAVTHYLLHLSWGVGFVLGAIVSPPDSVAPASLRRRFKLPRRMLMILEGESLVNDATALVAFSLAVRAVETNAFSPTQALMQFLVILFGEAAFGCLLGAAVLKLRHIVNDPRAEILIALATPYLAFWPPHQLGGSGVIACFTVGLYVSWNGRNYIRPATRLQGFFIWDLVTWVVEALTFLICGLQTREIVAHLTQETWPALLTAGVVVSATVIVVRFLWVFPVTYLPRWLWPPLRMREKAPSWRPPFLVGFAGLRGAVSLAAALSIPLIAQGAPFPHRDLILFSTIAVIVATLVGQGAALGPLTKWLDLGRVAERERAGDERAEMKARAIALDAVLARLAALERDTNSRPSAVTALRKFHGERRSKFLADLEPDPDAGEADLVALQLDLLGVERASIAAAYDNNLVTDETRRRLERELDLEEASIRHGLGETGAD